MTPPDLLHSAFPFHIPPHACLSVFLGGKNKRGLQNGTLSEGLGGGGVGRGDGPGADYRDSLQSFVFQARLLVTREGDIILLCHVSGDSQDVVSPEEGVGGRGGGLWQGEGVLARGNSLTLFYTLHYQYCRVHG